MDFEVRYGGRDMTSGYDMADSISFRCDGLIYAEIPWTCCICIMKVFSSKLLIKPHYCFAMGLYCLKEVQNLNVLEDSDLRRS